MMVILFHELPTKQVSLNFGIRIPSIDREYEIVKWEWEMKTADFFAKSVLWAGHFP